MEKLCAFMRVNVLGDEAVTTRQHDQSETPTLTLTSPSSWPSDMRRAAVNQSIERRQRAENLILPTT